MEQNDLTVQLAQKSNNELLSIILKDKLKDKSLNEVLKMDEDELRFNKLTEKQIETILLFKEINKRIALTNMLQESNAMNCPKKIYDFLIANQGYDNEESFQVIFLNNAGKVIKTEKLASGTHDNAVIPIDALFRKAILVKAHAIIIAHNHPSGTLKPSHPDISTTCKIKQLAEVLGIQLLDHIIVGSNNYYSFRENGLITSA